MGGKESSGECFFALCANHAGRGGEVLNSREDVIEMTECERTFRFWERR